MLGSGELGLDCLVVLNTVEDGGAGELTGGKVVPDEVRVVLGTVVRSGMVVVSGMVVSGMEV